MEKQIKDVFLCHAHEDKKTVVRPLAEALKKAGISYWLDEAELRWGDGMPKVILTKGLASSQYVIVILSSHFLKDEKTWPQTEFYTALNEEISSGEVKVLPLLVGSENDKNEILDKYPMIKGKLYLSWDDGAEHIVHKLLQRLQRADKAEIYNGCRFDFTQFFHVNQLF